MTILLISLGVMFLVVVVVPLYRVFRAYVQARRELDLMKEVP